MNNKKDDEDANTCEQARSSLPFIYQCMNAFLVAFFVAGFLRLVVYSGLFENGQAVCIGIAVLTYGYGYVQDQLSTTEGGANGNH